MSDYCVCKDCGCKHLVWEKSCPYCRRIAELEAENKVLLSSDRVKELEAELKATRGLCVSDTAEAGQLARMKMQNDQLKAENAKLRVGVMAEAVAISNLTAPSDTALRSVATRLAELLGGE